MSWPKRTTWQCLKTPPTLGEASATAAAPARSADAARFVEALKAEGVPASEGWSRPLYRNGVFPNAHIGPPHGIRAPLAGMGVDYRGVSCPVCEQVCGDAVWIPQNVLLADEPKILRLAAAIRKVVAGATGLGHLT